MDSPCNKCTDKDKDKNSDKCANCEKRIKYAVEEGMLPKTVLKETIIEVPKTPDKPIKEQNNKSQKDRVQINFHFSPELLNEAEQIMNDLREIGKKELRRTTEQALYFIREGIERYKSNKSGGIT